VRESLEESQLAASVKRDLLTCKRDLLTYKIAKVRESLKESQLISHLRASNLS